MNLFIKNIGKFILFVFVFLVSITLVNRLAFKHINPFGINADYSTLILGDSHSKYAFNDKIIRRTYNFSNDADSYFYSYIKLKHTLKTNPKIDTVLLSFSIHNIQKSIEQRWLLNNNHINDRLKLYFPLFGVDEYVFLLSKRPAKLITGAFSQIIFPFYLSKNRIDKYGGYQDLNHNILDEELKKLKQNNKEDINSFIEADIEKEYLQKSIKLCKANDITIILVNPPLHKSLWSKQKNLYLFYNKYFSDVLFYDFSQIDMRDNFFGDLVHLSPSGARYLAEMINVNNLFNPKEARAHNILYKQ
jgi:hypothetical protein